MIYFLLNDIFTKLFILSIIYLHRLVCGIRRRIGPALDFPDELQFLDVPSQAGHADPLHGLARESSASGWRQVRVLSRAPLFERRSFE